MIFTMSDKEYIKKLESEIQELLKDKQRLDHLDLFVDRVLSQIGPVVHLQLLPEDTLRAFLDRDIENTTEDKND